MPLNLTDETGMSTVCTLQDRLLRLGVPNLNFLTKISMIEKVEIISSVKILASVSGI
jgi:hypothetical protein